MADPRGSTLLDLAVAVALFGLVAMGIGGAFKAVVSGQTRQADRVRLQREAAAAARRVADVLRAAGWGLNPGEAPVIAAGPDAFTVEFVDPATSERKRSSVRRVSRTAPGGTVWSIVESETVLPAGPTVERVLAGFADVEKPTSILGTGGALFTYFGPGETDLTAALADPDPGVVQAALRSIRRVRVTVRLDGDGDGVADVTYSTSAGVWNRP